MRKENYYVKETNCNTDMMETKIAGRGDAKLNSNCLYHLPINSARCLVGFFLRRTYIFDVKDLKTPKVQLH